MTHEDLQQKFAVKIAKLLTKAESTTKEEAEQCIAKAQELMAQYAIEQAMIDKARGVEREQIEQRKIYFTGNYRRELKDLAWRICNVNNCMGVQYDTMHDDGGRKAVRARRKWDGTYEASVSSSKKAYCLEITGFTSDLERVLMLESSLRLQAMASMTQWWEQEGKEQYDWETYSHKVRIRQEFMEHFAYGVADKLRVAADAGKAEAIKSEAVRTGESEEATTESVALVLRSRKDQVKDWYDNHYGKLRSGRYSSRQSLSGSARTAGRAAGQRADVGQSNLRSRGALSR